MRIPRHNIKYIKITLPKMMLFCVSRNVLQIYPLILANNFEQHNIFLSHSSSFTQSQFHYRHPHPLGYVFFVVKKKILRKACSKKAEMIWKKGTEPFLQFSLLFSLILLHISVMWHRYVENATYIFPSMHFPKSTLSTKPINSCTKRREEKNTTKNITTIWTVTQAQHKCLRTSTKTGYYSCPSSSNKTLNSLHFLVFLTT